MRLVSRYPLKPKDGVEGKFALDAQQVKVFREWQEHLLLKVKEGALRSRLEGFGGYLYQTLLPKALRQELSALKGVGHRLLLIADQESWLPWELLHDGQQFLAERFIIGRWWRELGGMPPDEFPMGQVLVVYDANIESPQQWAALIQSRKSPPAQLLSGGMLTSLKDDSIGALHLLHVATNTSRQDAPLSLANLDGEHTIEHQIQSSLKWRRHRPLVTQSYISTGQKELTNLSQKWAPLFIEAGLGAFVGSLWTVSPTVEAAFMGAFYHHLWAGSSLGEALQAGRNSARIAEPESLDWLAYVLFGDPMARPYRPVLGYGYAVVELIGRHVDEPLMVGESALYQVSLRRTPPLWHAERVVEVAKESHFGNLQARIATFELAVLPSPSVPLTRLSSGDYLGWFTLEAPAQMGGTTTQVQVYLVDGFKPIHSLMFELKISKEKSIPS